MTVDFVPSMILSVFCSSGVLLKNIIYSKDNHLYYRGYMIIMSPNTFFISSILWVKHERMVHGNIIRLESKSAKIFDAILYNYVIT